MNMKQTKTQVKKKPIKIKEFDFHGTHLTSKGEDELASLAWTAFNNATTLNRLPSEILKLDFSW